MATHRTIAERFWSKVARTSSGCLVWTGYCNENGYGYFRIDHERIYRAHRFAYQMEVGPIPDGLELDHLCRVRNCVNPEHLEPVTAVENMRRAIEARPPRIPGAPRVPRERREGPSSDERSEAKRQAREASHAAHLARVRAILSGAV